MWAITTISGSDIPLFYTRNKETVHLDSIDWFYVDDHTSTSFPRIRNNKAAYELLRTADIPCFKTKPEARAFAKSLPNARWQYLKLK